MNHEEYERQMIDCVNHNAEETNKRFDISGSKNKATTKLISIFNKNDKRILARGFRRTILALLTATMFALSVFCLVVAATAQGYLAVVLFFAALIAMGFAFILLYAQGITHAESQGDSK